MNQDHASHDRTNLKSPAGDKGIPMPAAYSRYISPPKPEQHLLIKLDMPVGYNNYRAFSGQNRLYAQSHDLLPTERTWIRSHRKKHFAERASSLEQVMAYINPVAEEFPDGWRERVSISCNDRVYSARSFCIGDNRVLLSNLYNRLASSTEGKTITTRKNNHPVTRKIGFPAIFNIKATKSMHNDMKGVHGLRGDYMHPGSERPIYVEVTFPENMRGVPAYERLCEQAREVRKGVYLLGVPYIRMEQDRGNLRALCIRVNDIETETWAADAEIKHDYLLPKKQKTLAFPVDELGL